MLSCHVSCSATVLLVRMRPYSPSGKLSAYGTIILSTYHLIGGKKYSIVHSIIHGWYKKTQKSVINDKTTGNRENIVEHVCLYTKSSENTCKCLKITIT